MPTAEIAQRTREENRAELLRGMAVLDDEMADYSSARIALYKKDTAQKARRALDVLEGDEDGDVGKKATCKADETRYNLRVPGTAT